MVIEGSPNPANHHCEQTDTWKAGARYGRSEKKLRENLRDVAWADLRGWPVVAQMKSELLGVPIPEID